MFTPVDPEVENAAVALLWRATWADREWLADASPYEQARERNAVLVELLQVEDAAFDRIEREARRAADQLQTNLAPFVRGRLADVVTDLVDARWHRWAAREELEGRNPYQVWTPAAA